MRTFFDRKPDSRSTVFAEAQALLDDGLDLDFVLGLFPDDADWLRDELDFTTALTETIEADAPSYFFEASLKSKFLAAGQQPRKAAPAERFVPVRTAMASMSIAAGALAAGVITLGFVTAGSSVPGDWNYSFKLANERLQYTLSSGDDRVNIQLKQTEARVEEIQRLSTRGDISGGDIDRLNSEVHALAELARGQQLNEVQKAKASGIAATGNAVLTVATRKQPQLEEKASAVSAALDDVVTAIATPNPTASPTAVTSPTATPSVTPEPSPSETPTSPATTTPHPTPSVTPTSVATPDTTPTPAPSATAEPTHSPTAPATSTPIPTEEPTVTVSPAP